MKPHYEVVAAIIKKDDKYLLAQRKNKGETALKWEFPGGKIEVNESHQQALIREIKEEFNSIISIEYHIISTAYEYNSFNITIHFYLCSLIKGNLDLKEHINKAWVSKDDFHKYDIAPADLFVITKL